MISTRGGVLLLQIVLLLNLKLILVHGEPPVTNYMANLYNYIPPQPQPPSPSSQNTLVYDHHHLLNDPHPTIYPTSSSAGVSGVSGGYDDHSQNPYQLVHPTLQSSRDEKDNKGYEKRPYYYGNREEQKGQGDDTRSGGSHNGYGGQDHYHEEEEVDHTWGKNPIQGTSYGGSTSSKKGYGSYSPTYGSSSSSKGSQPSKYGGYGGTSSYGKGSLSAYDHNHSDDGHSGIGVIEDEVRGGGHEDEHQPPTYSTYKSPSGSPPAPLKYGTGGSLSGYKELDDVPVDGYSPYTSAYHKDAWHNTMKGGYDDYGYINQHPRSPGYKGHKSNAYNHPEYISPAMSGIGPKDTYSYGTGTPPGYNSYGDDEEVRRPTYSSPYTSSKSLLRRPPSSSYGKDSYFSSPGRYKYGSGYYSKSKSPSYTSPKESYSYSSKGGHHYGGYPSSKYSKGGSSKGPSSYSHSSSHYDDGNKGPSYFGKQYDFSKDISNYYRTRSGGISKNPPILRTIYGYRHYYTTIGYPNSVRKPPMILENGRSEHYGRYNWENDGWTTAQ